MDGVPARRSAGRRHSVLAPSMVREQPRRVIIALRTTAAHQDNDLTQGRVWTTLTEDVP